MQSRGARIALVGAGKIGLGSSEDCAGVLAEGKQAVHHMENPADNGCMWKIKALQVHVVVTNPGHSPCDHMVQLFALLRVSPP